MWLLLKNLVFTLVAPGTAAVLVPYLVVSRSPTSDVGAWGWPQWAAVPVALAGVLVYGRCVWDFAHRGRGTPAPIDAPRGLVVEGLYRYVRNPMYLGVLLVILAQALFFESRALAGYAAAFFATVHLFTVLYEEPTLRRRFDGSYERYRRSVRRWIPGRPYSGA